MQRGPCFRRTTMQVTGNISFIIASQTADEVCGEMPVQSGILNPFGVAHAGAILWFADVCATVLAFGKAEIQAGASGFPLAINLSAALLGNQKRSEEHTSELQSLMRISYAVFCLKKKIQLLTES